MSTLYVLRYLKYKLYNFLVVMANVLLDSFCRKSKLFYVVDVCMFKCTCVILSQLVVPE
jgi:hypothetical protein